MPSNKTVSLPNPQRERWQPLRSGFLNLYRYDREEFHYENGRLLLRGNNGTGKSRVLALQLPFLLDGEVISQRLEPRRSILNHSRSVGQRNCLMRSVPMAMPCSKNRSFALCSTISSKMNLCKHSDNANENEIGQSSARLARCR